MASFNARLRDEPLNGEIFHSLRKDAVLFTPRMADFWGLVSYLHGAELGSTLRIQPPVREGMEGFKRRLGNTPMVQWGFFRNEVAFQYADRQILPFVDNDMIAGGLESFWILENGTRPACPEGFINTDGTLQDNYGLVLCECDST